MKIKIKQGKLQKTIEFEKSFIVELFTPKEIKKVIQEWLKI